MMNSSSSHISEIANMIMIEPVEDGTTKRVKYGSLQRFAVSFDVAENLCEDLFPDE